VSDVLDRSVLEATLGENRRRCAKERRAGVAALGAG
jgi:hypothetical protein